MSARTFPSESLCRHQLTVSTNPSLKLNLGCQPASAKIRPALAWSNCTSESSGRMRVFSWWTGLLVPVMLATISIISAIVTAPPEPTLYGWPSTIERALPIAKKAATVSST